MQDPELSSAVRSYKTGVPMATFNKVDRLCTFGMAYNLNHFKTVPESLKVPCFLPGSNIMIWGISNADDRPNRAITDILPVLPGQNRSQTIMTQAISEEWLVRQPG